MFLISNALAVMVSRNRQKANNLRLKVVQHKDLPSDFLRFAPALQQECPDSYLAAKVRDLSDA
jgi:hypothetical protein